MRYPVPRLYLGTMTFGWSQTSSVVDEKVALEMCERFVAHNSKYGEHHNRIDTARIYAGGKTELIVGDVLSKAAATTRGSFLVGTKAHPSQEGGLSKGGINGQFQASMTAMKMTSLEEYYLHQPDTEHSLLESLECLHQMVTQGQISKIGMSNYHASEMQRAFDLCKEHNLTPPSIFQGLYNPLNRAVEEELLPLLKKHNCSFVAFNPLAAGVSSAKLLRCDITPTHLLLFTNLFHSC